MSKVPDKPPVTKPGTASATKGSHVDMLLRLSKKSISRRGARGEGHTANPASERGWTREELYERGSPRAD